MQWHDLTEIHCYAAAGKQYVTAVTDVHATQELWEVMFSVGSGEPIMTQSSREWLAVCRQGRSEWQPVASGGQTRLGVVATKSWAVRQSPASKNVNTEAEESTVLEAITKWQPVKTQQTEKT
jgi:CDGSH-type Zn-finger protein